MKVEAWLRDGGASKRVIAGEVGALIASCALDLSTKKRLEDVRALIFHNWDLLQDPSKWPVKHTFQQLAAQEADTVFGDKYDSFEGSPRVIDLINKKDHPCRCIYFAESAVVSVCYSPDGSKLARAEANEVVLCCALTGFAQTTLCGHIGRVWSVSFAPDGTAVASGSGDNTIRIWDVGNIFFFLVLAHTLYIIL
jgi:WD40 repeat protein